MEAQRERKPVHLSCPRGVLSQASRNDLSFKACAYVHVKSLSTLSDLMDCSLPGSLVHGDSLGRNTGVSCHALLQGIFPTQGLNPSRLHCRQVLYHVSHQGCQCTLTAWTQGRSLQLPQPPVVCATLDLVPRDSQPLSAS